MYRWNMRIYIYINLKLLVYLKVYWLNNEIYDSLNHNNCNNSN